MGVWIVVLNFTLGVNFLVLIGVTEHKEFVLPRQS